MSDDALLEQAFVAASPAIEELVTAALRRGLPAAALAIVVERDFEGKTRAGCMMRQTMARQYGSDARIDEAARSRIAEAMSAPDASGIPALILVQCEGYVAAGIRTLSGEIVGVH
jgi:hypothetical protein